MGVPWAPSGCRGGVAGPLNPNWPSLGRGWFPGLRLDAWGRRRSPVPCLAAVGCGRSPGPRLAAVGRSLVPHVAAEGAWPVPGPCLAAVGAWPGPWASCGCRGGMAGPLGPVWQPWECGRSLGPYVTGSDPEMTTFDQKSPGSGCRRPRSQVLGMFKLLQSCNPRDVELT